MRAKFSTIFMLIIIIFLIAGNDSYSSEEEWVKEWKVTNCFPGANQWIDNPKPERLNPNPGRKGVLSVHPLDRNTPCTLERVIYVDPNFDYRISLSVSGDPYEFGGSESYDWLLKIFVQDKVIFGEIINAGHPAAEENWRDIVVYIPKSFSNEVKIRIQNAAGGWARWFNERGFFDYIKIEKGHFPERPEEPILSQPSSPPEIKDDNWRYFWHIENCSEWTDNLWYNKTAPIEHRPNPSRRGIWAVHPLKPNTPCELSRTLYLKKNKKYNLLIGASADPYENDRNSDWVLKVYGNDKLLGQQIVTSGLKPSPQNWFDFAIDLSKYAGQEITLKVQNAAGGDEDWWDNEEGFFDYLIITEDDRNIDEIEKSSRKKDKPVLLDNNVVKLEFAQSPELKLVGLYNLEENDNYVRLNSPEDKIHLLPVIMAQMQSSSGKKWLRLKVAGIEESSSEEAKVKNFLLSSEGEKVDFIVSVALSKSTPAIFWHLKVENKNDKDISLRIFYPVIDAIKISRKEMDSVSIPHGLGSFLPILGEYNEHRPLDFLKYVDIIDSTQSKGFIYALMNSPENTETPILKKEGSIYSVTKVDLQSKQSINLPPVYTGLHQGDWVEGAKLYYQKKKDNLRNPDTPAWFMEAGGIYNPLLGEGGGVVYISSFRKGIKSLQKPDKPVWLHERIKTFDQLPEILNEAKTFGTNVIFLYDYWDGKKDQYPDILPYMVKGDYIPRRDLGEEAAFKSGIEKLHKLGGKVITYVEPFIIYHKSDVGIKKAKEWSLINKNGEPVTFPYPMNWHLCTNAEGMRNHIIQTCVRLVKDYDVDGIFLDSFGYQWNHQCFSEIHNHTKPGKPHDYNRGVLSLVKAVRDEIRKVKPDAIVMSEAMVENLYLVEDGAQDNLFDSGFYQDRFANLRASNIKACLGRVTLFSNGFSLNQINQIVAAGHSLALSSLYKEYANYIRELLTARKSLKDAFVYGELASSISSDSKDVYGYYFKGSQNDVITLVNVSSTDYDGNIYLPNELHGSKEWQDFISGLALKKHSPQLLKLSIKGESLLILKKIK